MSTGTTTIAYTVTLVRMYMHRIRARIPQRERKRAPRGPFFPRETLTNGLFLLLLLLLLKDERYNDRTSSALAQSSYVRHRKKGISHCRMACCALTQMIYQKETEKH